MATLPRDSPQAEQGELRLGVTGVPGALLGAIAERAGEQIGVADGDVEERPLGGGLEVGHPRLDEVARAVDLVVVLKVGESRFAIYLVKGVDVAVGLLRAPHEVHPRIELRLDLRLGAFAEDVGRRLERLVDVRVHVHGTAVAAFEALRGALEVGDVALLAQLREKVRDRGGAVRGLARSPEGVGDLDRAIGHGPQLRKARGGGVLVGARSRLSLEDAWGDEAQAGGGEKCSACGHTASRGCREDRHGVSYSISRGREDTNGAAVREPCATKRRPAAPAHHPRKDPCPSKGASASHWAGP